MSKILVKIAHILLKIAGYGYITAEKLTTKGFQINYIESKNVTINNIDINN